MHFPASPDGTNFMLRRLYARRFQFSIGTLLLAVTALGFFLGLLVHRAGRQRQAILAVVNGGGDIYYDFQYKPVTGGTLGLDPKAELPIPAWARASMIAEFGRAPFVIGFENRRLDSLILDHLSTFNRLHHLSFTDCVIADTDLERIADLGSLEVISFTRTETTDVGLESLRRLSNLRLISIQGCPLSGNGLRHLTCTDLRHLNLRDSRITDEGLSHLTRFPSLQSVDLRGTLVTDAGLDHLAGMQKLVVVHLPKERITEAGLGRLRTAIPKAKINLH